MSRALVNPGKHGRTQVRECDSVALTGTTGNAVGISIPVWFVLEGEKLYLLPVQGSETRWNQHVLHNPWIRIEARGEEAEFRAVPVTGAEAVSSVVEKFREKYGAKDVRRYYSKLDVAVLVEPVR